jgi:hypothetical protein
VRGARATVSPRLPEASAALLRLLLPVSLAALRLPLALPVAAVESAALPLRVLRLIAPVLSLAPSARAPSGCVDIWDGSCGSRVGFPPTGAFWVGRSLLIEPLLPGVFWAREPLPRALSWLIEPVALPGVAPCEGVVIWDGSDGLGPVPLVWACTSPAVATTATAMSVFVAVFIKNLLVG